MCILYICSVANKLNLLKANNICLQIVNLFETTIKCFLLNMLRSHVLVAKKYFLSICTSITSYYG